MDTQRQLELQRTQYEQVGLDTALLGCKLTDSAFAVQCEQVDVG